MDIQARKYYVINEKETDSHIGTATKDGATYFTWTKEEGNISLFNDYMEADLLCETLYLKGDKTRTKVVRYI